MRLLKKMISTFLVVCLVISMVPMTALATEMDSTQSAEGRIMMDSSINQASVWIDGIEYAVQNSGDNKYVDLPAGTVPGSMVTYDYHVGDPNDVHTQYPVGMQVWALNKNADGSYTPEKLEELNNILQYSGSSIRITGKKGIRMITSIEQNKKNDLVSGGLDGYKLLEYGTVLAWSSDLAGGNPLVLGPDYAKSNYAYKKGAADPVFAYEGNLMQYTNVLVGFTLDECKDDIAMRPYMILEGPDGEQMTIYGGIVQRSIGYIAWQNRYVFRPGTAAYNYVWEIIRHVYGDISEVVFRSNGGTEIEPVIVTNGSLLARPAEPENGDLYFAGWYVDTSLTKKYDFSQPVTQCLVLYAVWSEKPVLPDNPSEADLYYFGNSEVLEVITASESEVVPTETEVVDLFASRGFGENEIIYDFTIDGAYVGSTNVQNASQTKRPAYFTYYRTENDDLWIVYVINDTVTAYPLSYNAECDLPVDLMISESETITSYVDETNQYYVTIPYESAMIVRIVERIDAETLEQLTFDAIDAMV